jgi:hypothetical protein
MPRWRRSLGGKRHCKYFRTPLQWNFLTEAFMIFPKKKKIYIYISYIMTACAQCQYIYMSWCHSASAFSSNLVSLVSEVTAQISQYHIFIYWRSFIYTRRLFCELNRSLFCELNRSLFCELNRSLFSELNRYLFCELNRSPFCELNRPLFSELNRSLFCDLNLPLLSELNRSLFCELNRSLFYELNRPLFSELNRYLFCELNCPSFSELNRCLFCELNHSLLCELNRSRATPCAASPLPPEQSGSAWPFRTGHVRLGGQGPNDPESRMLQYDIIMILAGTYLTERHTNVMEMLG